MIRAEHLIAFNVPAAVARDWVDPLVSAMARYQITTVPRQAAFLAQLLHESNGLRTMEENFNYSASALMATFNTKTKIRFPKSLAEQFGRTPAHPANREMIAMIAYADRIGNGGVDSGDGWRFRGRGPIQLTGRDNYTRCGAALGIDLMGDPDALLRPVEGALAAGWFWDEGNSTGKSLNALADGGQIDRISRVVNGGDNGLEHRRSLYEQALRVLA